MSNKEIAKVEKTKNEELQKKPGFFKQFFTHIHCASFFGLFLLFGMKSEYLNHMFALAFVSGVIAFFLPPKGLNPITAFGAEPIYAHEIREENEEIRKAKEELEKKAIKEKEKKSKRN